MIEGVDYTINEEGLMVLTEKFLRERGYCCGCGCVNCPYREKSEERRAESESEEREKSRKN